MQPAWLLLDKPLGLSSTQALGKVKRLLGIKKAGHAGTLDPAASGLLPIAFNGATRTIPFLQDAAKVYEFQLCFGTSTTTDDVEGEVLYSSEHLPSADAVQAVLPEFIGMILQTPPPFSALKVNGVRAYDLARRGEQVELTPRQVVITALELLEVVNSQEMRFRVHCGKGTYVRAIARDLAIKLGTYGHVTALRRTQIGKFRVEDAFSLENLAKIVDKGAGLTALLPLTSVLDDIPALDLDSEHAKRFCQGQRLACPQNEGKLQIWGNGQLLGIGEVVAGVLHPRQVFEALN